MSFVKLFAAGFGLRGGKDHASPYQVRQRFLPQFNAEREVGSIGQTFVPDTPRVDLFEDARAPAAPETEADEEQHPGLEELAGQSAPEQKAEPRSFFQQAVRRRKSTPERLVQAEMELEQVRVMRNDLAEADLEFVAVARKRGRVAGGSGNGKAAATVWGWLTERVFKSESN